MKYWLLLIFCTIIFSCKKNTFEVGKNEFSIERNISYGNNSKEKFDIYFPKNSKNPSKVFIIIHGGGWRGGDKNNLTSFTFSLMKKFPDFAFVNMNYIFADENNFAIPNQTENINSVINFLKINSKKFNLKNEYILLGNSAGGHLSMLYDYHFDKENLVKAVVNIVGPTNLSDKNFEIYSDYNFVERRLVNPNSVSKNFSKMQFASPINWVSTKSSPTLSFYGNSDGVIPLSQKKSLDSALNLYKIKNESYEFNGGHDDWRKDENEKFLVEKIGKFVRNLD